MLQGDAKLVNQRQLGRWKLFFSGRPNVLSTQRTWRLNGASVRSSLTIRGNCLQEKEQHMAKTATVTEQLTTFLEKSLFPTVFHASSVLCGAHHPFTLL